MINESQTEWAEMEVHISKKYLFGFSRIYRGEHGTPKEEAKKLNYASPTPVNLNGIQLKGSIRSLEKYSTFQTK